MSKVKQLDEMIKNIIELCAEEEFPITIVSSGAGIGGVAHAGDTIDFITHLTLLEKVIKNKMDDCDCPGCQARRDHEDEKAEKPVETADISDRVQEWLKGL